MERARVMLGASAADQAGAKEAAVNAANTRALRASLQALKRHSNSSTGWTAYTTALATAAEAGEHTCPDPNLSHPGNRCKPAEPGGVSFAERAKSLGIRYETFSDARVRMHNTNHDIAPRDAVSDRWDMYQESKKRDAPSHPRRQLMHKGARVWRMFLESRRYLALKGRLLEQGSSFTDPGRTTFLSTRCGCCSDDCMVTKLYPDLIGKVMEKSGKEKVGRRTLGTQSTGGIVPVISSDESPVAPTTNPMPSPTLDESMEEKEDGDEEMEEEREEEEEEKEEEEEEDGEEGEDREEEEEE
ncbi:unnamed protein product [Ectocarpus sp. CCAP 1310/34]|nr:unnamed protein product [Ectocarpus sp. CCAP 1310/34]